MLRRTLKHLKFPGFVKFQVYYINVFPRSLKNVLVFLGCFYGDETENMCPAAEPGTLLIGRTQYNIMMYDTR